MNAEKKDTKRERERKDQKEFQNGEQEKRDGRFLWYG